ncbi:exonuclease SbcCD subunit D [Lentilactobacillus hilgardii]|uniref:Nuclease SbcCD subunit D n=1 Tax=Lentilactobacillus hilgardii TaxID=1588 RepID=A0A6P1EDI3_LENHI|nr:exonuclease SbcCD subunit D [Lentilactobacillus hilgardii]EEI70738.1 exonuclease SbcCD, D subunit [Lentilactobacillus hilgardii ATCC 27305]MCT3390573.1 exonuclease SbcCD subunit D [Lentilactobacillus hilgardii]QHB52823.1 exonuclease subunit SbcD [Lentilactobacillus hilgardii]RRG12629.1 MAG: exonuclease SbcCD subunit D [Lactobacillus sp.]
MRFLHTADWHIGRRLHGFDLTDEQNHAFKQIEQIALNEHVDGVMIAGDLYDRSMPAEASVAQLNHMLQQLNLVDKLPIYAISGNHDSAIRLSTGTPWFKSTQFYMHTRLDQAFTPVELPDTQLFLLPYFEPFDAQQYFNDDSLQHLDQAFVPIVNKMKSLFDPNKKHLLISHFFVDGSATTDSETQLKVGGLAAVPVGLLEGFDYVALGHLHGKDALHAENARYSGSPVKFSLSEANQKKGVFIVDTEPFKLTFKPLTPIRDVQQLTENFETLADNHFYEHLKLDNYFGITLKDRKPIPNVMARLRDIYPNIISLDRADGYETDIEDSGESGEQIRQKDPMDLLGDFYKQVAKDELSSQQIKWAQEALKIADNGGIK